MPENESPTGGNVTGGASGIQSVGGGGGEGKAVLGGAGGQTTPPRALFLGHIFPAPLDKDGNFIDQSLQRGLGPPHLLTVVYAYDNDTDGADRNLHAHIDEILGQPYFKAYVYPVSEHNQERTLAVGGGGGEGRAVLGGAPGSPIYLGQFRAILSDTADTGGDSGTGGGATAALSGGGAPAG